MKKGFTVAELAITIGVIGVIAAITMSLAFRNAHGIEFETASQKLQLQLEQTLDNMSSDQTLIGLSDTKDFVSAFIRNISVTKTCPSSNLSGCFPETFKSGEIEFSLSDVKGSEFMGKSEWKTDVEGVILKNGFKLLIAYNPYCSRKNPQNCVAILYDLNSIEKDNVFAGNGQSDLGTFNAAFVGASAAPATPCTGKVDGRCVVDLGTGYSPVNCSVTPRDSYCPDGSNRTADYWAGAMKACAELGMTLPTNDEIYELQEAGVAAGVLTTASYWSSTLCGPNKVNPDLELPGACYSYGDGRGDTGYTFLSAFCVE